MYPTFTGLYNKIEHFCASSEEGLRFMCCNDYGDKDEAIFRMLFWNRTRSANVEIAVYFNVVALRNAIQLAIANQSPVAASIAVAITKKYENMNAQSFQGIATRSIMLIL